MQKTTALRTQALKSMNGDSLVSIISTTHEVQSRHHSLLESLQTTLELEQLLSIFAQHIAPMQLCSSLRFVTDDNAFTLLHNQAAEQSDGDIHQHTALLYADDLYLGQLVYNLRRPLSAAVRRALDGLHRQLTFPLRNAMAHGQARQQAIRDYLTGLGNRSYLEEVLQHAIYQQQRLQTPFGMLLLDLDGFKAVNDNLGHQHGDEVLKSFGTLLREHLRDCDQVFRFGGDEFVILLEDTSLVGVQYAFSRLQNALQRNTGLAPYNLTMSAGAVMLGADDSVHSVLQRADEAMYSAKNNGKNQLCCRCK